MKSSTCASKTSPTLTSSFNNGTPTPRTPPLLVTTSSPTGLLKRRRDLTDMVANAQFPRKLASTSSMPTNLPQPQLTGLLPVTSVLFKTKASAVHAGPSLPPVLLPTLCPFSTTSHQPTNPSNNLFPAHPPSETRVATVAGTSMHGTTCKPPPRSLLPPTHTPQETSASPDNATLLPSPQVSSTLRAQLPTFTPAAPTLLCSPLSLSSPTQLLSRLTNPSSNNTLVVSSPPLLAEPPSTTPAS